MKKLRTFLYLCVVWSWVFPALFTGYSLFVLIDEGVADLRRGENNQYDYDFVAPVKNGILITGAFLLFSCCTTTYVTVRASKR